MFKRVDHVEIIPSNIEKTLNFYTEILGFKITSKVAVKMPLLREVFYLQLGDTVVEIMDVENATGPSKEPWQVGYKALALEVEDMTAAVAYLKSKGVPITRPPVDLGDSFRGEIVDPDGLCIELRQWKKN
jgi:catechol 2,3-dioxygenase-like lactoylglutathione lyase family enzyme